MRKAVTKLTFIYYCMYILAILSAVAGYYFIQKNNIFIEEYGQNGTTFTSIYIIYLVISIPLALKLFNINVRKLGNIEDKSHKIKKYTNYSLFRLVIIGISLIMGIFLFYYLNSRSMIFCAGIAAIALVFCRPSEVRMATDLDILEE